MLDRGIWDGHLHVAEKGLFYFFPPLLFHDFERWNRIGGACGKPQMLCGMTGSWCWLRSMLARDKPSSTQAGADSFVAVALCAEFVVRNIWRSRCFLHLDHLFQVLKRHDIWVRQPDVCKEAVSLCSTDLGVSISARLYAVRE